MNISLSPIRAEAPLTLSRSGDVLTINGEAFDFSSIPEGGELPRDAVACDSLASDVRRIDGVLVLTLLLPHGANAPHETRFPAPIVITGNGPVALPPFDGGAA